VRRFQLQSYDEPQPWRRENNLSPLTVDLTYDQASMLAEVTSRLANLGLEEDVRPDFGWNGRCMVRGVGDHE
jgi:hypothetical protein